MVPFRFMVIFTLLVSAISGDNWFSRRRNQQSFQRPLSTHFRQRIGSQGRNPTNFREQQRELQPVSTASLADRESASYPQTAYEPDTYSTGGGSYGGGYGGGGYGGSPASSSSINPLSALVAPLAALALLGAAAAVATNPVLLSIAVLSSGRKRRSLTTDDGNALTPELETQLEEMEVLEKYMAKIPHQEEEQEKLMATYLSCSGFTESNNNCLDRVVCEYSIESGGMPDLEKEVISIVLFNIMTNGYVTKEFKERLRTAAQFGRNRRHCDVFYCNQLTQKH